MDRRFKRSKLHAKHEPAIQSTNHAPNQQQNHATMHISKHIHPHAHTNTHTLDTHTLLHTSGRKGKTVVGSVLPLNTLAGVGSKNCIRFTPKFKVLRAAHQRSWSQLTPYKRRLSTRQDTTTHHSTPQHTTADDDRQHDTTRHHSMTLHAARGQKCMRIHSANAAQSKTPAYLSRSAEASLSPTSLRASRHSRPAVAAVVVTTAGAMSPAIILHVCRVGR